MSIGRILLSMAFLECVAARMIMGPKAHFEAPSSGQDPEDTEQQITTEHEIQ